MSVEIYSGVAYGFTLYGSRDEIQEEINNLGYEFEAIQIDGNNKVHVGVDIGSAMKNIGDVLTEFDLIEDDVVASLEALKSKMEVYSETRYVFYFFYE